MEDVDDELVRRSVDFIDRSAKDNKPFFLWHNTTRTHVWTHLGPKWQNKSGYGLYADAIMNWTRQSARYSRNWTTPALPTTPSWSSPAITRRDLFLAGWRQLPFRGEKGHDVRRRISRADGCEVARHDQAGPYRHDIIAGEDFLPTFLASRRRARRKEQTPEWHAGR